MQSKPKQYLLIARILKYGYNFAEISLGVFIVALLQVIYFIAIRIYTTGIRRVQFEEVLSC